MLGKNLRKEERKDVVYIHTNIVTKNGVKNTRNKFPRLPRIVPSINVGKNRWKEGRKKLFLYTHEYRDQKMGWKTRETIFPEIHE